ncbi:MAG: hypothetical protein O7B81_16605 [Gammaproteobacteria bacterium]|nr:hypothetical protein [Gammaproteobacteria bacterium]
MLRFVVVLFMAGNVYPDQHEWMKKANPNELAYAVLGDRAGCPISVDDTARLISNSLNRARIKALHQAAGQKLVLGVYFTCRGDTGTGNYTLLVVTDFVNQAAGYRYGLTPFRSYEMSGNVKSLKTQVRDAIDSAVTDYLRVNFDLASWPAFDENSL